MTTVGFVVRVLGCSVVFALAGARPAAALSCGQHIGPGAAVVLGEHLGCDGVAAALVVTGPAELDLNGFSIACTDADGDGATARVGILLLGSGVKVRDGAISGCDAALIAAGSGRHRIDNVAALLGPGDGIVLASDRNRVRDGFALSRGGAGFVVGGRGNLIVHSDASNNRDGFQVVGPATLLQNFASANERDGFLIAGETGSVLLGNRALASRLGFSVHGGRHRLIRNEARKNIIGIFLDERSSSVALLGNVASGNTATGIVADGDRNRLASNRTEDNLLHGVRVPAKATSVAISGTRSRGNRGTDLRDEVPGCGTNRWRRNSFETRNQDCVQ